MILKKDKIKAFTLIELIVVIAIIALLVLLAAPRFLGYTKDANVTSMNQDIKVLSDAAEIYSLEEGSWPIINGDEPNYIGYGGIGYIYPIDESKLQNSIKNINGDYEDYGIVVDGKYRGQVFHKNGVESKDDELAFGGNLKLPNFSARPKPQTKVGINLVKNGDGSYGDNTNFSGLTYDGEVTYNGKPSFKTDIRHVSRFQDSLIPVDTNLEYKMSYAVKSDPGNDGGNIGFIYPFDVDGLPIDPRNHVYIDGTTTTLAQDLKKGDNKVYLSDASDWINYVGSQTHQRTIIFWDYSDSTGYTYPHHTYSKNTTPNNTWVAGAVNYEDNTIELRVPWPNSTVKAGTKLSNGSSGGTFKYPFGGVTITPDEWTSVSATIQGIDYSGKNKNNHFPPGTRYVSVGWLINRGNTSQYTTYFSDIKLEIVGSE